MNKQELGQMAVEYVRAAQGNKIQKEYALSEELAGIRMYGDPIAAFGAADDPLFEQLKENGVIGSHHRSPKEWLAGAQTVISFFLPFTEAVKKSNRQDALLPSSEWLHARIEGQAFINEFSRYLQNLLKESGAQAVVPALDERFWAKVGMKKTKYPETQASESTYTSNWSERHAAYICGLGTFGLSRGLITQKGVAGRLCSIITDLAFEPDIREYTSIYGNCSFCGACIKRCPVLAISKKKGKEHPPCSGYLDKMEALFSPRYGCGKCQTGVPCESIIPVKIK